MKLLHRYTKDGLNLLGCYWEENPELKKDCCVVFTHGMFDNILENTFAHVLGEELSENGYGFIFGHNRGYGVINIQQDQLADEAEAVEEGGVRHLLAPAHAQMVQHPAALQQYPQQPAHHRHQRHHRGGQSHRVEIRGDGDVGEICLHIERPVAVDVDAGPLQQLRQGQIEQSEQIGRDGGGADNALGLLLQLNTVHHVFCVLSLCGLCRRISI